ncbi:trans-sulfuration enzyme family protein [Marinobacter nauticus]|uniref:trans-sulfuration enzyme family protein n=1 Tax=Marinobacter nauticus TaxID=2743 RepID=UPI004044E349
MEPSSKCVHNGAHESECHPINTPIYASTVSRYINAGEQYYPRYFNTVNQDTLAAKISALEAAEKGIVFSSGMAAISTTCLALLRPGDQLIIPFEMYGGSIAFAEEQLRPLGIEITYTKATVDSIKEAISEKSKMIFFESPTNPFLSIIDIQALASLAKKNNIITVIDNTFASPINQRPIELGIDISIHSGTKFLSGHSDLCCGAAVGPERLINKIQHHAHHFGGCLNALDCYLLDRSLKTLAIRVREQNTNAFKLAEILASKEVVNKVYYPGLSSHIGFEVAAAQMSGPGSLFSIEFKKNSISIPNFLQALDLITPGISLGGVETTVCAPALTSHHKLTEKQRLEQGIRPELLRFSIGIEAWEDLANDILKAIKAAKL